jgi:trehalose 6-phosphate synthase/phosphatase
MSRLIIVSHRLPFSGAFVNDELILKPSMGGLVSGLLPLLNEQTVWVGSDGITQKLTKAQRNLVQDAFQERGCTTVRLPQRAHHAFYNDISNGIFWPLYHNQTGRLPLTMPHWSDYQLINRLFAERLAEIVKPGDTVWIHDYHLQLLPKMLREKDLGISIAFFLHIPFPPAEIFRMLPIRDEILEGILGADTIGFHTDSYVRHFQQAAQSICSYPKVAGGLLVDGRRVEIVASPLGVDGRRWENLATCQKRGILVDAIDKMREDNPELRILFSVDRLDYTKGLPRKLLALERLLEKFPDLRGKITLIQIAPGSRDNLSAYSRYKLQVEQMIGSINGKFGFPGYQPIHYYAAPFSAEELGQAYRKINVMLVSPLMDGMNLVAKEFIASRPDHDGVLVLSEFAGATHELPEALLINPYDVDETAQTMLKALTMPQPERQQRMQKLRERVMKFDAREWVQQFFNHMKSPLPAQTRELDKTYVQNAGMLEIIATVERPLTLFIDYDGTLFPIVRRPDLAAPDSSLIMLLSKLSRTPGVEVHIVSGRRFDELFHWFNRLPLHIHGEHGGISFDPVSRRRSFLIEPKKESPIMQRVQEIFHHYKSLNKGVLIEKKAFSTVLHYRMAEVGAMERHLQSLTQEIMALEGADELDVLAGKKNIEVRIKGISKAQVVERRLAQNEQRAYIAIGDDRTDEEMFAALKGRGLTISVGDAISDAHYNLRDSSAVREFLRLLEAHLNNGKVYRPASQAVCDTPEDEGPRSAKPTGARKS